MSKHQMTAAEYLYTLPETKTGRWNLKKETLEKEATSTKAQYFGFHMVPC